jgi:predicted nucleic acid-binding protein
VKPFFDTNVIIYAQEDGRKAEIARERLRSGGVISVQVVNEATNVLRRKYGADWDRIGRVIGRVLNAVDKPLPITMETYRLAVDLARSDGFSFFDALLLAAAIKHGCEVMYSEDMQHGRVINGLEIRDPFI